MITPRDLGNTGQAIVAVALLLIIAGLVIAILAWGRARYDAGVSDTDAKWEAAGRQLEREARRAGTDAGAREADRIKDHTARTAEEKEKIDAAIAAGDSPLDALFGGV